MKLQDLGFVGLGSIGAPMAARFVSASYQVTAFDVASLQERLPSGAAAADSVKELAARVNTILLSLPNGDASKSVCSQLAEPEERKVETVVDLSTIGVAAARECAQLLEDTGVTYVDAPVSGGVPGARNGTLTVMVGTKEEVFEEIGPLLSVIAKNYFRMGDEPGCGQVTKLLNNFLSATALAATSEAVSLGVKMGLNIEAIIDAVNASSGRNTASADKFPKSIIPETYDYGFAGALMKKDLDLYLESVEDAAICHDIASTVAQTWRDFNDAYPDKDFTYIYKYLEEH
jgi:3-hydroxyisobutyrate dehydrogenase